MGKTLSESEEATREMGAGFAAKLSDTEVVALYGELGSGKTQFIKGICFRLGVKDIVNSPTFVIVNEYMSSAGKKIFHYDLYRMKSAEEVMDTGFEDYIYKGLVLIEWPELIESILPENTKKVFLSHYGDNPNLRMVEISED